MRITGINLILVILATITSCVGKSDQMKAGNALEFESPGMLGFSADSLHQIESFFQEYVDHNWIPGASALVARKGKIVYECATGYEQSSIFRWASMTKPLTATAILQLAEAGKLKLNDPLSRYIPEFAAPCVLSAFHLADTTWEEIPASREITIHDLLTHTSGISYAFMDPKMAAIYAGCGIPDLATPLPFILEEKMACLGTLPLVHHPGERYTYGLSSDVLGRVVEVASGMTLKQYIRERITGPLGMNETYFFLPEELKDRLVAAFVAGPDSSIASIGDLGGDMYDPDYPIEGAGTYYSGGSGLNGSIRDYFLFCQAILNGGMGKQHRILNDTTVAMMLRNQLDPVPYWPGKAIGYGFEILTEDNEMGQLKGRFSWFGTFQTFFYVDPQRELVAIAMSQVMFSPLVFDFFAEFERIVNSSLVTGSPGETGA